jgi:GTP-binding protein
MLGRKNLARTSGTPGKTQALNFYLVGAPEVDQGGREGFYLVDLPGYGYAKVSKTKREKWQGLIGRYVTEREPLRVVVHLIDSRHPPQRQDVELIELMRGGVTPYVIALTKADKLSRNGQSGAVAEVRRALKQRGIQAPIVLTSAEKKQGADELWQWVETLIG